MEHDFDLSIIRKNLSILKRYSKLKKVKDKHLSILTEISKLGVVEIFKDNNLQFFAKVKTEYLWLLGKRKFIS